MRVAVSLKLHGHLLSVICSSLCRTERDVAQVTAPPSRHHEQEHGRPRGRPHLLLLLEVPRQLLWQPQPRVLESFRTLSSRPMRMDLNENGARRNDLPPSPRRFLAPQLPGGPQHHWAVQGGGGRAVGALQAVQPHRRYRRPSQAQRCLSPRAALCFRRSFAVIP
jgi:hypothetical protein